MDLKVYKVETYRNIFITNETNIYSDISSNPGTTRADIASRTGVALFTVSQVLDVMFSFKIVQKAYDTNGNEYIWTMKDWVDELINNLSGARAWLSAPANDGGTSGQLAGVLGVNEAVAAQLVRLLAREGMAIIQSI